MSADFSWQGFQRGSRGVRAGFVRCELCGTEWGVPKCWLREPGKQCVQLLERHRSECQARSGAKIEGVA